MKKSFKKAILLTAMAVILMFVTSGCITRSIDDLYKVPQPSKEYLQLQSKIDEILSKGAEYAAPIGGSYRQSVQLYDIDGDGTGEALAFFRMSGEKPLKIYVFRNIDGKYEVYTTIEGDGTSIESINYADLDEDGITEVIVGWTMKGDIQMLGVYSLHDYEATALMLTDYTDYLVYDIDNDEHFDLSVIRHDRSVMYGSLESYFFNSDGEIESRSTKLSAHLESINRIRTGTLSDGRPAIYVEGIFESTNLVTDIIAYSNDSVFNITLDPQTGISDITVRSYWGSSAYSSDINGDGCIDVPSPQVLPAQTESTSFRIINWYNFNLKGIKTKTASTYHNYQDYWYLTLPNEWVDAITIRREDTVAGERAIVFSLWNGETEAPTDFLAIYTLTGDNRADKAESGGRFTLFIGNETVYSAKIILDKSSWQYAIGESELRARFGLIYSEWITGTT